MINCLITKSVNSISLVAHVARAVNTGGLAHKDDPLLVCAGRPAPIHIGRSAQMIRD